jgi:hypothetical protein
VRIAERFGPSGTPWQFAGSSVDGVPLFDASFALARGGRVVTQAAIRRQLLDPRHREDHLTKAFTDDC